MVTSARIAASRTSPLRCARFVTEKLRESAIVSSPILPTPHNIRIIGNYIHQKAYPFDYDNADVVSAADRGIPGGIHACAAARRHQNVVIRVGFGRAHQPAGTKCGHALVKGISLYINIQNDSPSCGVSCMDVMAHQDI